jgi:hypothetical protein
MSNFREYDISDAVRFEIHFTIGDVPTDPTTVTLYVKDPAGVTVTYNTGDLTHPETGTYYRDVEVDQSGRWAGRMVGDGAVNATAQEIIDVRRSVA